MPDLIPFHFGNHEVRVHVDEQGLPWWEAQNICNVLGIHDVSKAVARLRSKEKRSESRNLLIINESGLYRLIMRSNKLEAQAFQDWVFEEVLPSIRKTGRYDPAHPKVRDPAIQMLIDMAVQLDAARALAIEAKEAAAVASTKADLALEDAHRMTLEEFILKNGLVRQFPPTQLAAYTQWLKTFCASYGLSIQKAPVYGKSWDEENSYPLAALGAWLRYETRRPRQVHLIHTS